MRVNLQRNPMKSQSQQMYRGNDNKKAKITKAEKVFDAIQKERRELIASLAAAKKEAN